MGDQSIDHRGTPNRMHPITCACQREMLGVIPHHIMSSGYEHDA